MAHGIPGAMATGNTARETDVGTWISLNSLVRFATRACHDKRQRENILFQYEVAFVPRADYFGVNVTLTQTGVLVLQCAARILAEQLRSDAIKKTTFIKRLAEYFFTFSRTAFLF